MATKESTEVRHDLIVRRPGVCGGSPCIKGTRMPVWSIVNHWRHGVSEGDLQNYFGVQLSQADIKAALAYYREHQEEIDTEIRENEEA